MGGREDLDRALKAIMADRREELGGPPSPEELLAYRDGELGPAERESVEARLAVFPEAARALASLAVFPDDLEPGTETPELSKREMDDRWKSFRQGLEKQPEVGPHPPAPSPAPPKHTLPGRGGADFRARERFSPRRWTLRLAAAVLLSLALGFFAGRASRPRLPDASVNVTIAELSPVEEGGTRSVSQVEFPDTSEELVLVLGLPGREYPDYRAEILGSEGARLWSREGLRPGELGTFHLAFRREFLPPGRYLLQLFGREAGRETLLATYELRLAGG